MRAWRARLRIGHPSRVATELPDPLDEHAERAASLEWQGWLLTILLAVLVALLVAGGVALMTYKPDGCHVWQQPLGPAVEGDPDFICVGRM